MQTPRITSPYAPDISQVRAWLEKMLRALKFSELVAAVVALVTRMGEINAELAKQLANLRRRRPRSETLERLERQLTLPLDGILAHAALRRKDEHETKPNNRRRRHPGRAAFPAKLERVEVPNPVPPAQRRCPICGKEMKLVVHSRCETLNVRPAKVYVEVRIDETLACPTDDTIVSSPVPP